MWAVLAVGLLASAFLVSFWQFWTLVLIGFGVPEFIGARVQDDRYPPLTHVIVKYVHPELGLPLLYFMAGSIGTYWFGAPKPWRLGALVAFIGWLDIHFSPRYYDAYHEHHDS